MGELPKTMKALVAYGLGDYRLELDYPVPECGPDDIIIKTEACGICAGDLKCMHGAAMFWGDEVQPRYVEPPFIPGHEFLGHIVKMGENVSGFSVGDRITADQIVPCGTCRFCKSGPILDVPAPRHLRISERKQRGNGGIRPLSQKRGDLPGAGGDAP